MYVVAPIFLFCLNSESPPGTHGDAKCVTKILGGSKNMEVKVDKI